jgi:hypothetical protein
MKADFEDRREGAQSCRRRRRFIHNDGDYPPSAFRLMDDCPVVTQLRERISRLKCGQQRPIYKKTSLLVAAAAISVMVMVLMSSCETVNGFSLASFLDVSQRRTGRHQQGTPWLTMVSTSTSASSFSPVNDNEGYDAVTHEAFENLRTLTLKELRQLVSRNAERGVLSRLKRKQDFVDYLLLRQQQQTRRQSVPWSGDDLMFASADSSGSGVSAAPASAQGTQDDLDDSLHSTSPAPKPPSNGSSLADDAESIDSTAIGDLKTKTSLPLRMPSVRSPKDAIFEQVYQRYPPLRDSAASPSASILTDESETDDPQHDIRQAHHPALQHVRASDMDIVCVGTASCAPGISRGVSCTAIRLNWSRRDLPDATTGSPLPATPPTTSFQGGTWLFDVGECTQVRLHMMICCRALLVGAAK